MGRGVSDSDDLIADASERPDRLRQHRLELELKASKAREAELLERLHEAEARNDLVEWVRSRPAPKPIKRREKRSRLREATAFLQASDWHVGEEVRPEVTGGRNEYTPAVARRRIERLSQGYRWLTEMHRSKFKIRDVVLLALGDFVTGWLHQDQIATNTLLPMPEVFLAKDLLRVLIDDMLDDPELASLTIVCTYGNHGRTTLKPLHSARKETNLEWLIYGMLQQEYAGDKRVQFDVAGGKFVWLPVYDFTVRASHGDDVRGGGGIGGLMAPVNRAIFRWNQFRKADIDVMGHHHTTITTPSVAINGSVIGMSGYGMGTFGYEPPTQNTFLIEPGKGKRADNRIWLEHT